MNLLTLEIGLSLFPYLNRKGDEIHMNKLIALGYWKSEKQGDMPKPEDFIDFDWNIDTREAVISYLKELDRPENTIASGYTKCNLNCMVELVDLGICSDGTFVWPRSLVHYVEYHGVIMPNSFIEHVFNANKEVKSPFGEDYCIEYSWWKSQTVLTNQPMEKKITTGKVILLNLGKDLKISKEVINFIKSFEKYSELSYNDLYRLLKAEQSFTLVEMLSYFDYFNIYYKAKKNGLRTEFIESL